MRQGGVMDTDSWDNGTRLLHWGLAVMISFQIFSGLLVATPGTLVYFYVHEWGGLATTVVIALNWFWSYANYDLALLFPWNDAGMADVVAELQKLRCGRLPRPGRVRGLSSFGHGLGLLAVTGMAVTGTLIYVVIPGGLGALAHSRHYMAFTDLVRLHKVIAGLVWVYWVGHVGFAFLHQVHGGRVFGGIFGRGPARSGHAR